MIRVGLTGSMAAGKSEVANILRDVGIPVFDADAAVHEMYSDGTVAQHLPAALASAVSGDKVDRGILSRLLLEKPQLFAVLESIVHPLVHQREADFFAAASGQKIALAVADLPLLMESGRDEQFDAIVLVCAPESQRRKRALARPGMTAEKFDRLAARQLPETEKRKRATHIIENDSSLAELRDRTMQVIDTVRKLEK